MFYHLNGTVAELTAESLVLDCNGIGFEITITPNTACPENRGTGKSLHHGSDRRK